MILLSEPFFGGKEWKYVKECIDTAWVSTAGKYVERFERDICAYTGAANAVACMNGTSGLQIALLLAGVKPGDEVIVPTLTFIAPVNAIRYVQAEPVFMDCDDYMNISAEKLDEFCRRECLLTKAGLKNKKSGKIIKAVIPVHIFGNPCLLDLIMKTAGKYKLKVIEDATESLGTYFTSGKYVNKFTGTIGDFGVFSFNGNKIITTGGGGMIVSCNRREAEQAKYLTTQAKDDPIRYVHHQIGYNFRLTNIQAALGVAQLEQLERFIQIKKKNYKLYEKGLENIAGLTLLGVPAETRPNYWFYSLLVDKKAFGLDREQLMKKLQEKKIQARPIWYLNHWQKPYRHNQSYKIEKACWYWERVLNIPCSTGLKPQEIQSVITAITR